MHRSREREVILGPTLYLASGRLVIPRIKDELTVAAVGGNLVAVEVTLHSSTFGNNGRGCKGSRNACFSNPFLEGNSLRTYLSKSSKMTVSGTISLNADIASSSVPSAAGRENTIFKTSTKLKTVNTRSYVTMVANKALASTQASTKIAENRRRDPLELNFASQPS